MRITVDASGLDDLASDLRKVAVKARADMVRVVQKNVAAGERAEKRIAKAAVGRHGKAYPKRITSEMTGDLEGEWGPHGGGTPVGGGWRHGVNTDSAKSLDVIAPKFGRDIDAMIDRWFWPS